MTISKMANGFYTFSDNHFKAMRKQDLINYIRTIEKNWENSLITNNIQYENCKRLLEEERNKAIDEFAERLNKRLHCAFSDDLEIQKYVNEIAEKMRGAKHEKD